MKIRKNLDLEAKSNRTERYKLVYDFLKHLTTLSSGSILAIVALAEKFFNDSASQVWLLFAIVLFIVSIALTSISMLALAVNVGGKLDSHDSKLFINCSSASIGMFILALAIIAASLFSQYG